MAISDELNGFVREALARGTPRPQVEEILLATGWSRDQVKNALAAYADVHFPIPVPRPTPYLSAREAFMYLLLFSMLYVSAYNLGALLFAYINLTFPDASQSVVEEYTRQSIRWALASLIGAFPVFLYMSLILERGIRADPGKRRSNVRRWLMYMTIFAASCVLIGDFITLIYNALGGELTTRFVLKVLTIAAIAGTILAYYLSDLRLEDTQPVADDRRWKRPIAAVAVLAAAGTCALGLSMSGPPSDERERRLDARRIQELRAIAQSVRVYWNRQKRLPGSLDDLAAAGLSAGDGHATEIGPYEYRSTGERTYEICATFDRAATRESRRNNGEFWAHAPGRQCFQLEAEGGAPVR